MADMFLSESYNNDSEKKEKEEKWIEYNKLLQKLGVKAPITKLKFLNLDLYDIDDKIQDLRDSIEDMEEEEEEEEKPKKKEPKKEEPKKDESTEKFEKVIKKIANLYLKHDYSNASDYVRQSDANTYITKIKNKLNNETIDQTGKNNIKKDTIKKYKNIADEYIEKIKLASEPKKKEAKKEEPKKEEPKKEIKKEDPKKKKEDEKIIKKITKLLEKIEKEEKPKGERGRPKKTFYKVIETIEKETGEKIKEKEYEPHYSQWLYYKRLYELAKIEIPISEKEFLKMPEKRRLKKIKEAKELTKEKRLEQEEKREIEQLKKMTKDIFDSLTPGQQKYITSNFLRYEHNLLEDGYKIPKYIRDIYKNKEEYELSLRKEALKKIKENPDKDEYYYKIEHAEKLKKILEEKAEKERKEREEKERKEREEKEREEKEHGRKIKSFHELSKKQLLHLIEMYNEDLAIQNYKNKTKEELANELDKHLEIKEDGIYFRKRKYSNDLVVKKKK